MLLLVGLGNPGAEYEQTRHNIGFAAVDAIADAFRFSAPKKKFRGMLAEGEIGGQKVLILKPLTYMNLSGEAVGEAARFYKIPPQDIVVFYDELDLPPGKIRVKKGGGNAGHNGLKSLDAHIGAEYWRVRIGIGHPGNKALVSSYVLSRFAAADRDTLRDVLETLAAHAKTLTGHGVERYGADVSNALGRLSTPPAAL